jgi:hypothetical protein
MKRNISLKVLVDLDGECPNLSFPQTPFYSRFNRRMSIVNRCLSIEKLAVVGGGQIGTSRPNL